MSCISSVSFALLINGAATKKIHAQQELRQGCPLSPLLFLLVAERLNKFIKVAKENGHFGGIPIARDLYISHLLFVDDILIFCNGSRRDTDCLVEGIELFKRATGMLINVDKSSMITNLVSEADLMYLAGKLPFHIEPMDGGLKYLGFHLKPNSYRKEDWMWLIGKLEKRILVWSHRWLSREG